MENLKDIFKNRIFLIPFLISSGIFVLSFLAGLYLHDVLIPIVGEDISIDNIEVGTVDIIKNNMTVFFINVGLSIVTFGIYGIIANAFNAGTLGIIMGIAEVKFGLKTALLRIIPHGVIEIPLIILSTMFGFVLIGLLYRLITKKKVNLKKFLIQNVFVLVVMAVLVVIAAVIEGQISMNLS